MMECPQFCWKFTPEFTLESTRTVFIIKFILVLFFAGCLFLFENYLDERVFDTGSSITFATVLVVVIFNLTVSFLVVVYVPYMWHISPLWYSLIITILYVGSLIYFTLESLIFNNIANVDDPAFDGWTIVHTLAGVWLGFILPFIPLCYVICIWEVLEADWTEGLGDGESISNHVTDVLVAVVGWFFTVLLCLYVFPRFECKQTTLNCTCMVKNNNNDNDDHDESQDKQCLIEWKQSFYRIPWISARASSYQNDNNTNNRNDNTDTEAGLAGQGGQRGQPGQTETQMTQIR